MPDDRSQGRAAQETQRRRRRSDTELSADKRLLIPPEVQAKLDAEGLMPRWVNDDGTGSRIARFTKRDDYDVVEGVEPVPIGTDPEGRPLKAYLLAKPKDFIREDRNKADARRKLTEEALFRKPDAADQAGASLNPNPATAQRYVANETKIGRANQVLDG